MGKMRKLEKNERAIFSHLKTSFASGTFDFVQLEGVVAVAVAVAVVAVAVAVAAVALKVAVAVVVLLVSVSISVYVIASKHFLGEQYHLFASLTSVFLALGFLTFYVLSSSTSTFIIFLAFMSLSFFFSQVSNPKFPHVCTADYPMWY